MTVRVVTDSSACLTREHAGQFGIHLVPIHVTVDGASRPSWDLDRDSMLRRVDAGDRLTTSAPLPGEYIDTIEAADDGDGVVVVTLAASMSSTHQVASLAGQHAQGNVEVVDTGTAAGGVGLVAVHAARVAAGGAGLDEVVAAAEHSSERVQLLAVAGSLKQLAASGRVPQLAERATTALGVRLLFSFSGGQPHLVRPSLSRDAAEERMLDAVRRSATGERARLHVTALHGDAPEAAQRLLRAVKEFDPGTAFVSEFDAAMVIHTGPDLLGLAWWWEPA